jgi:putative heme-binding domain-containing protein
MTPSLNVCPQRIVRLLALAMALMVACPPIVANAQSQLPLKKPRISFSQNARVMAYQLGRLSNEQLVLVERKPNDLIYRPVYEALLARAGLEQKIRQESLDALVKLNSSDTISEITAAIGRVASTEHAGPILFELTGLLLVLEPSLLATKRDLFEGLATGAESHAVRISAFAALLSSAPGEEVWKLALASDHGLHDLLRALPRVHDPERCGILFPRVMSLLRREGIPEKTSPEMPSPESRGVAIESLPSFTGHEEEAVQALVDFIRRGIDRETSIRTIQRFPPQSWPKGEVAPLAEIVVEYARGVPVAERTSSAFLDAIQFGNALAMMLEPALGKRIRSTLDELGVPVVLIRTLPHQMLYDKRRFAVEVGKPVEVILENRDIMPHNMIITLPDTREQIGKAAEKMTAQPDEQGRHYVPVSESILYATRMLGPGKQQKLSFIAPKEPGFYPYLCTFPGHWMRMYGTMVVVEDMEAYLRNPPPIPDELVLTEWQLRDLVDDLQRISPDQAPDGGKVFATATCAQCHRLGKAGKEFGPDLTEVFKRWKGNSIDVLREILEPSRKIDEKYQTYLFELDSGMIATGMITAEDEFAVTVQTGPTSDLTRRIPKEQIEDRRKHSASVMPIGLLNPLTKEQILALLSFLKYGEAAQR